MDHDEQQQSLPKSEALTPSTSAALVPAPHTTTAATQTPTSGLAPPLNPATSALATRRRKGHRGGEKEKKRNGMSYLGPTDGMAHDDLHSEALDSRGSFYARPRANLSNTSIDSAVLLDHRTQSHFMRPRRPSLMGTGSSQPQFATPSSVPRLRKVPQSASSDDNNDDDDDNGNHKNTVNNVTLARGTPPARDTWEERVPLLSSSSFGRGEPAATYGTSESHSKKKSRPNSRRSSRSSLKRKMLSPFVGGTGPESYNVNYPPSVPGSPPLRSTDRSEMNFGDLLLVRDGVEAGQRPTTAMRASMSDIGGEADMPALQPSLERRNTIALQAEEDVCFPHEGLSELAEDDEQPHDPIAHRMRTRRGRGKWPELGILEEWSRFEREGRSEERRSKKITEPQLINGRLRPVHKGWYRSEDDAPYRFTYFNEEFQSTIHSQSISELVQAGCGFRELFTPDPPLMSDSSDDEEEPEENNLHRVLGSQHGEAKNLARQPSLATTSQSYMDNRPENTRSPCFDGGYRSASPKPITPGDGTPTEARASPLKSKSPEAAKPPRYGERPVWWLDVLSPTDAEMKVLAKAFGIHPLTAEDIMMQEQREKVELFRNYYFVNYRSFDQDQTSENFLKPVNMYVVVFREGVLSFHFNLTPHPANVRRRIRQLRDYLLLSPDWISYGIIDDITDAFGPLIQNIEDEVDDIDDAILKLHSSVGRDAGGDQARSRAALRDAEKKSDPGGGEGGAGLDSAGDMLWRVGDCRKKVMSLYRLLSNKADVIKGFAKRCNEHWEVAPRSEIGLYLGDIQDHIVTMTSNLGHYEKILSRSHANYLAQINIRMNERQEQTADVLGRLTVLGTIVLPMNIITGLWGMNVWVPGQAYESDLTWFAFITAGLLAFGVACYLIAKRVYQIV